MTLEKEAKTANTAKPPEKPQEPSQPKIEAATQPAIPNAPIAIEMPSSDAQAPVSETPLASVPEIPSKPKNALEAIRNARKAAENYQP